MSDELALVVVFSGAHTRARAAILDWLAQCVSIMPPSAGQGRLPRVVYTTEPENMFSNIFSIQKSSAYS